MNRRLLFAGLLSLASCAVGLTSTQAAVKPHALFSNGAVLQHGIKAPVWGTAADGEKVTVTFQGQEKTATAADGKWRVDLEPLKPGGPFDMVIQGTNKVEVKNLLVGDVWICSGQSNMQWSVDVSADAEKVKAESANPMIRLFNVTRRATPEPQTELLVQADEGKWLECGPTTVGPFSAVGYHFGRAVQKELNVPIGLIGSNYGGTPAEAWTSRASLDAEPLLKARYNQPATDQPHSPSGLYNAMIHPLLPYGIKGAVWYQGESNASEAWLYRTLFPNMIKDWRMQFGHEIGFYHVQLAPFQAIVSEPQDSAWAELREAQLLTALNVPQTGMAVITDVGDEKDIHPIWKEPVGKRLALAALAITHGKEIEYSGPQYDKLTVKDGKATLSFTHLGDGLVAKDGPLTGFTIAGADQKFHNATAEIVGDTVVVSSPAVTEPAAVRFGWADFPVVNFWNKAGLPASPFRTDDFPMITKPK